MLVAINSVRIAAGLAPLVEDPALAATARAWSYKMRDDGWLSHDPDLAQRLRPGVRHVGQNVGYGPDVKIIEHRFVESRSHYLNLVDPDFAYVGVGVITQSGSLWVTTEFRSAEVAPNVVVSSGSRTEPSPTAVRSGTTVRDRASVRARTALLARTVGRAKVVANSQPASKSRAVTQRG